MNNNLHVFVLSVTFLLTICGLPSIAYSQNGGPIADLLDSVDQIEATIEQLTRSVGSIETVVDCTIETITEVLEANANTPGYLTIIVQGMCIEDVLITRSRVRLRGDALDGPDSIKPSGINGTALSVNGANEIVVEDLIFEGNPIPATGPMSVGIHCRENATVKLLRVNVSGFGTAVFADGGGHCNITDSEITNNLIGARNRNNGTLRIESASTIENYEIGMLSERGGYITIIDSTISAGIPASVPDSIGMFLRSGGGIRSIRTTIKNNDRGVVIRNLGMLSFNQGTIQDNVGEAINCRGVFDLVGVGGVIFSNNGPTDPGNECPQ